MMNVTAFEIRVVPGIAQWNVIMVLLSQMINVAALESRVIPELDQFYIVVTFFKSNDKCFNF